MNLTIGDGFTEEEIEQLKVLSAKLGFSLKEKAQPEPIETKVVKGVVKCNLCHTVTVQYIQLIKIHGGIWKREKDVEIPEGVTFSKSNTHESSVRCCWNCKNILLQRDKEELADLIIRLYAPTPTQQEIWKHVKELRESKEQEVRRERNR
jgi:hypothetical protein